MFIPLGGENILCLANVAAIYREGGETVILRRSGAKEKAAFTPPTLADRSRAFLKGALYLRAEKL
ncbi:hypothetical protein [Synergistes jonesii]|uniref:Uncharacterized protein n=1 Tax=Synergistes jonesii TaxID=2754 RepID=A0A073IT01_9BACT|nr:hypothetical protein [Synergistes jonesii]KEJ92695.1 hypothetical protein EH55_02745 [Synergistes jonesii]OFB63597.1 hypothetical protein JS73_05150 [Synergistes jonesii]OFB63881.1 hypothetical protein JS72_06355 [Synergistes jonesii]OFB64412.1 hypothetical protein JS79_05700 [Synergistes jonesii]OFB68047.1 hypothetical protein JS78_05165 [Synergistes jonesii]